MTGFVDYLRMTLGWWSVPGFTGFGNQLTFDDVCTQPTIIANTELSPRLQCQSGTQERLIGEVRIG